MLNKKLHSSYSVEVSTGGFDPPIRGSNPRRNNSCVTALLAQLVRALVLCTGSHGFEPHIEHSFFLLKL